MRSFTKSGWFGFIAWAALVVIFAGGAFWLVSTAFAHAACDLCRPELTELALGLFFYGGLAALLGCVIVAVSLSGRVPQRLIVLPAIVVMVVLLVASGVVMAIATPA
jgi:uncharacterized membrane protein YwaF